VAATIEGTAGAVRTWSAPECRYPVEYSTRVLDDIRLAVMDAFFSLPRGGAEVGGILLGGFVKGRIVIEDYQALDCEHAMGPSFTLSARDEEQLAGIIARANESGRRVVGWYHSHTRSEIFLSRTDQDLHQRFFPEPWQVALVIKPHTFDPARCGFFFREPDGSIRGEATYKEFALEPLLVRPVPSGELPAAPARPRPLHRPTEPQGPVITVAAEIRPEPEAKVELPVTREAAAPVAKEEPAAAPAEPAEDAKPPAEVAVPQFLQIKPGHSWKWVMVVAPLVAVGTVGYQTSASWLPLLKEKAAPLVAKIGPVLPKPAQHLSLVTADDNGQLQIHWDATAPAVADATSGKLSIADGGGSPKEIQLDRAHLHNGSFTYGRASERVDVTLMVAGIKEVTSFLGKLPVHAPPAEDPGVHKERDDLRQESVKLREDLGVQETKTRKLEKDLNDVREQLKKEVRRRMGNQAADPGK
jgi:proteasome lid subunit RPN8/RPN11